MSKRIKRVFSNHREVLHLWASQSQSDARSSNVYFNGESCYSYGSHYELGRLVTVKGEQCALINTTGYSSTTSKHIGNAYNATSHMPQLAVSHSFDMREALLTWQDKLVSGLMNSFSRRIFWNGHTYKDCKKSDIDNYNAWCIRLDMPNHRLNAPKDFIELYNEHVKHCLAKNEVKRIAEQAEYEKQRIERAEKAKECLAAWLTGADYNHVLSALSPMHIRIKNDIVETTGGASVALREAIVFYKRLLKGKAKKGQHIGPYVYNGKKKGIVTIGCHSFKLSAAKEVLDAYV